MLMSAAQGHVAGMPRVELLACPCGLAQQPDLDLGINAFSITELECPLPLIPPSSLTFTKLHVGPDYGSFYRDGRFCARTSPRVLEPLLPSKRNRLVAL